jgi:hypothetical protein
MNSGIPDRRRLIKSKLCRAAMLAAALTFTGCQIAQPRAQDRVTRTPILEDDAMSARDWPKTEAIYPNFSVTTGSAQSLLVPKPSLPAWAHAAMETPVFLANVLLSPITMVQAPPWAEVETVSFYLPPSYTDNPPLDPSNPNDFSGGPKGPQANYNTAIGRQPPKVQ